MTGVESSILWETSTYKALPQQTTYGAFPLQTTMQVLQIPLCTRFGFTEWLMLCTLITRHIFLYTLQVKFISIF